MRKWIKDDNGLFITNCLNCGEERRTKKRPYDTLNCLKCTTTQFGKGQIRTYSEESAKKISIGRKNWWKTQDSKKLLKNWLSDYIGSKKHIDICKSNQRKATKAALGNKISKPEKEYSKKLKKEGILFKQQYYVGGFPFDFYIPSKNLLIEIDGEFYHPLKEEDCIYDLQKHNFKRDIIKTKVAKDLGYELKRIRV